MISLCGSLCLPLLPCSSMGTLQATVPSGTAICKGLGYMGCGVDICLSMVLHRWQKISFRYRVLSPLPTLIFSLLFISLSFLFSFFFPSSSSCPSLFALSWIYFHRGTTSLVEELSCALQWVIWNHLEQIVPGTGQARLLFTWGHPCTPSCQNLSTCLQ